MADIGRSTASHVQGDTQSERDIHRLLTNWGDFLATVPNHLPGEYSMQPMFREYVAGYSSTTRERRSAENIEAAEALDPILATLAEKDICCLLADYVLKMSSRQAARLFCEVESRVSPRRAPRDAIRCSYRTYQDWLKNAVINAELRITYATGISLDREMMSGARKIMQRVG